MATAAHAYRFPPGPTRLTNPIGKLKLGMAFQRDFFGMIEERIATFGDLYAFHIDNFRQYVVTHPDDIHRILVTDASKYVKSPDFTDRRQGLAFFLGSGLLTSDGEFWKRQRRLIQPAFHARRIESYGETMVTFTQRAVSGWRDGMALDVDEAMMRLTLEIVARSLFHSDLSDQAEKIGHAMTVLQHMFSDLQYLPPWLPTPARWRKREALRTLDAIVYGLIADWERAGEDRGDLLSTLMLARDEDGEGMSRQQVRDEAVTLVLAGHETTANALNWAWVLLAQNPDVEATLHAELDAVLGGRPPVVDDLKRLPYTEMVVKETLRLYPPAYGFSRQAAEDAELRGYSVPKGTIVGILSYIPHRDPRWWNEPERFRPERFSEEDEKAIPRYAYLPFGGGPRVCVGNSFAMMEARLVLATIAQHYRLRLDGPAPERLPLITLRPKGGLRMRVEARRAGEAPRAAGQVAQPA